MIRVLIADDHNVFVEGIASLISGSPDIEVTERCYTAESVMEQLNKVAVDVVLLDISFYARKAGKLAAFTETGLESIPDTTWWTGSLLKALKAEKMRLAYVLVWRNDARSATHFYAPYPGHTSVSDFMEFYKDPYTVFEADLPRVYQRKRFLLF